MESQLAVKTGNPNPNENGNVKTGNPNPNENGNVKPRNPNPNENGNIKAENSNPNENGNVKTENSNPNENVKTGNSNPNEDVESGSSNPNGNPEFKFPIRRLELSDRAKGFIELLSQLSTCPSLSESQFQDRFAELALEKTHYICVIEDLNSSKIVATGSLFIEKKFIRGCSAVGHIEDVVVDRSTRGARLGQRLVKHLVDRAKDEGCYKVILDCDKEVRVFYEKCGFVEKNVQMAIYF